jgi:hypothetical protein
MVSGPVMSIAYDAPAALRKWKSQKARLPGADITRSSVVYAPHFKSAKLRGGDSHCEKK